MISNDGSKLYVTQQDVFNDQGIEQKGVVVIDTATNTVGRSISVAPSGANTANWDVFTGIPAITPDGAYVYVPMRVFWAAANVSGAKALRVKPRILAAFQMISVRLTLASRPPA